MKTILKCAEIALGICLAASAALGLGWCMGWLFAKLMGWN